MASKVKWGDDNLPTMNKCDLVVHVQLYARSTHVYTKYTASLYTQKTHVMFLLVTNHRLYISDLFEVVLLEAAVFGDRRPENQKYCHHCSSLC